MIPKKMKFPGTSTWYCTPEGRWLPEGPNTTTCESDWVKKRRDGLTDALKNKDASALPEVRIHS